MYRARTAEDISKGKISSGGIITVDGVTFGPRDQRYAGVVDPSQPRLVDNRGRPFGVPSRAMLLDNRLWLETGAGLPFPGSACDRFAKGKCENGMANALAGAMSPFGVWPDAEEAAVQGRYFAWRSDPVEYDEAATETSGLHYKPQELATKRARALSAKRAIASGADPHAFATSSHDIESAMEARIAAKAATNAPPAAPPVQEPARKRAAAG